mmetsp:Transcript_8699/g.23959  ORF Transcript_8699/g.23959 Transcript_8699/m.23959 type:complete len:288 (+) Transcript_8699:354-1217(+)
MCSTYESGVLGLHEEHALALSQTSVHERAGAVSMLPARHVGHQREVRHCIWPSLVRPRYGHPVVYGSHRVRALEETLQATPVGQAREHRHGPCGALCGLHREASTHLVHVGYCSLRLGPHLRLHLLLSSLDRLELSCLSGRLCRHALLASAVECEALLVLPVLLLPQQVALCGHGSPPGVARIVICRTLKASQAGPAIELGVEAGDLSRVRSQLRLELRAHGRRLRARVLERALRLACRGLVCVELPQSLQCPRPEVIHLNAIGRIQAPAFNELLQVAHAHLRHVRL